MALAAADDKAPASAIRLGFDTYSLRAFRWKAIQLLDYAAGLKLDTIQISSLGDYESLDPEHLAKVQRHAASVQVSIDGGIGCVCPLSKSWKSSYGEPGEYILRGLQVAKAVGAASMRCFMGSSDDRLGTLPRGVSEGQHAIGSDHRPPTASAALSRSRILEEVLPSECGRVRAIRRARQTRTPVRRLYGD